MGIDGTGFCMVCRSPPTKLEIRPMNGLMAKFTSTNFASDLGNFVILGELGLLLVEMT